MILAKIYLIDDRSNAQLIESDLFGTIEMLVQIANNTRNPPDGLVQLVDMIKMSSERIEQNLQMSGQILQHFLNFRDVDPDISNMDPDPSKILKNLN